MIACFPLEFFINSKYCSSNTTRIGGLFDYLNKNHQKEISIYKFDNSSNTNPLLLQIFILIDHLIKLYTLGVHKQLGKYNGVKELLIEFNSSLDNLDKLNKKSQLSTKEDKDYFFGLTKCVLEREYLVRGYQYALLNDTVFASNRKQDIIWLLKIILQTLEQTSSSGCVFSYLPHYYLVTCLNLTTSLRFYFNNESSINNQTLIHANKIKTKNDLEYEQVLKLFAQFITYHFGDERVVNNDHKEMIAQSLISLIGSKQVLPVLENISIEFRLNLIKKLTQAFENRPWTHSLTLLLKFWRGFGFAFKNETFIKLTNNLSIDNLNYFTTKLDQFTDCNPSIVFQKLLSDYFNSNPKQAYIFLTSLLNQLNFSFSEFVTMFQDIQNSSVRQETFLLDSRQLKICCTCYDLSNSLLRVLEMILHYNVSLILTNNSQSFCADKKYLQSSDLFNENFDLNSLNLKSYLGFVNDSFDNEFDSDFDSNLIEDFDKGFGFENEYDEENGDKFELVKLGETKQKQSIKECLYRKQSIQENNEILLQELCSICNQIINRIIISSNCFNYVRQQMTNLESINDFNMNSILSSVIGALVVLIIQNESTRYLTLNLLVNDLNFQLSSYLYLIDENQQKKKKSTYFLRYLNDDEIKQLKRMLIYIVNFNDRNEKLKSLDDFKEDELCEICFANKKTAVFYPCKHQCCERCWKKMHSLFCLRKGNESKTEVTCFFCKTQLEKVQTSNQVIYPQKIRKN